MDESRLVQIGQMVSAVVGAVEGAYPGMRLDEIKELVSVREWKVGIECLLDNLHEENRRVATDLYLRLVAIGKLLGIEPMYWETLSVE